MQRNEGAGVTLFFLNVAGFFEFMGVVLGERDQTKKQRRVMEYEEKTSKTWVGQTTMGSQMSLRASCELK